jgi:aryl-alcohol dehydrogenase-like predicted oxidoreductase
MDYLPLGRTGIAVSRLSFGAGPISTLMVGTEAEQQRTVVEHAIRSGVNWFDTAATYGEGCSERALGEALAKLKADWPRQDNSASGNGHASQAATMPEVHVATKVRLMLDQDADIQATVRRSFEGSLERLQLQRVTLLQLHNSITRERNDEPTSVTPVDVLGPGGVVDAFEQLRREGLVAHLGLTGLGQPASLREVVQSGAFDTMQVPYNLLNPSAGRVMPEPFGDTNYGNIMADCAEMGMGVLAIRVLAGGALADSPPSPYTYKTRFFPLELYQQDRQRAAQLRDRLAAGCDLKCEAIRFALAHPNVASAIIGFAAPWQIDEALAVLESKQPCLDWEPAAAVE